jgi:hypothetical protein
MEREYPQLMHPILLEEDIPPIEADGSDAVETLLEQGLITHNEAAILRDPAEQAGLYARFAELNLLDGYVDLFDIDPQE